MKLLSIIVPVYNGEDYINRCIESLIVKNRLNLYEILIINDGSQDNTKARIHLLSNRYENIRIFNKKNGGVSEARNIGICQSVGEYICFCDHDDEYEEGLVGKILDTIQKNNDDFMIFHRKDVKKDKVISIYNNVSVYTSDIVKYLEFDFAKGSDTYSVCNKVYKSKIINNNKILFDNNLKLCEDLVFNLSYISKCKSAKYIDGYYIRYCNEGSAIYRSYNDFFFENIKSLDYVSSQCNEIGEGVIKNIKSHLAYVSIYRILSNQDCDNISDSVFRLRKINFYLKANNIYIVEGYGINKFIIKFCLRFNFYYTLYFILAQLRNKVRKNENK